MHYLGPVPLLRISIISRVANLKSAKLKKFQQAILPKIEKKSAFSKNNKQVAKIHLKIILFFCTYLY